MKQIILVRHGEAMNNIPNSVIGGWSNVELTELGIKQAEAVAERLLEDNLGDIPMYTSDLRRARHTAEIIAEKLGKTLIETSSLREHNSGIASGMDREEAKKIYIDCDPPSLDWSPYPEGETWREFIVRVTSFMDDLAEKEERALLVSHGGPIDIIIRWWINLPISEYFNVAFSPSNTSITVLDVNRYKEKRIERLNDTAHYSSLDRVNRIPAQILD